MSLSEEFVNINSSIAGTGIFKGDWTTPGILPKKLEFSAPSGRSEIFHAPKVTGISPVTYLPNVAQSFTIDSSDTDGAGDIAQVAIALSSNASAANAIIVSYDPAANLLYLGNDAGNGYLTACTPGVGNNGDIVRSNTQGVLNCTQSSVSKGADTISLTLNLTPFVVFSNMYLYVQDSLGLNSGIISPPTVSSLSPSTGIQVTGAPQTFTAIYSDEEGASNITQVFFMVRRDSTGADSAILLSYDQATNTLYLGNDAGTAWLASCTPGTAAYLSNSQGTLDCGLTTISVNGNNLTVNWRITPNISFVGIKNIYLGSIDASGLSSAMVEKGPWTITLPAPAVDFSGSPRAGTLPFVVNFSDLSSNYPYAWSWDFGDGHTGTLQNPYHVYRSAGSFTVSLSAGNDGGWGSRVTKYFFITANACGNTTTIRRGGTPYISFASAYNGAQEGESIQSQALLFNEAPTFNRPVTVKLDGGYGCDYNTGKVETSVIQGLVTIQNGTVIFNDITVQ